MFLFTKLKKEADLFFISYSLFFVVVVVVFLNN